jgi:hypothetical protein
MTHCVALARGGGAQRREKTELSPSCVNMARSRMVSDKMSHMVWEGKGMGQVWCALFS